MNRIENFFPSKDSAFGEMARFLARKGNDLTEFRRHIHQHPDIGGQEKATADFVKQFLQPTNPDQVIEDIGGAGIAFVYGNGREGPSVMIRSELDALPIREMQDLPYRSEKDYVSHKCGHDGHMAIVAGLGWLLSQYPPEKGRVVLLYQPSEETGEGSQQILDDPSFKKIEPDYIFALHNIPGKPLGRILRKEGVFAVASEGLIVRLHGSTSHAAHPEEGRSPAGAVAQIIQEWSSLTQRIFAFDTPVLLTVVHARIGEVAFGTTPGEAEVMATIRAYDDQVLQKLSQAAEKAALSIAATHGLTVEVERTQRFEATTNDRECTRLIGTAARELGYQTEEIKKPYSWSEDFGRFTSRYRGAQFGIGSGEDQPPLHHPEFDFPDALTGYGSLMFYALVSHLLNNGIGSHKE